MIQARRGPTNFWKNITRTPKWFQEYAKANGYKEGLRVDYRSYAQTYDDQGEYWFPTVDGQGKGVKLTDIRHNN